MELSEKVVGIEKTLGLSVVKLQTKVLDMESQLRNLQHEVEDLRQNLATNTTSMDLDNLSEYFNDTFMQSGALPIPASVLYGEEEHKNSCPSPRKVLEFPASLLYGVEEHKSSCLDDDFIDQIDFQTNSV